VCVTTTSVVLMQNLFLRCCFLHCRIAWHTGSCRGPGLESCVILFPARRAPPVRGEDRVHLSDAIQFKVLANLLFARCSGPGHDHEGGPSCRSSFTTVTFRFAPTSNN
jgi:hypothetical protein